MAKSALKTLFCELIKLIEPLKEYISEEGFRLFLADIGYAWPEDTGVSFSTLGGKITELEGAIEAIDFSLPFEDQIDEYATLFQKIQAVITAIVNIIDDFPDDLPDSLPADFSATVGKRILDFLICTYLEEHVTGLFHGLRLLGIIRSTEEAFTEQLSAYTSYEIYWDKFPDIFTDLKELLRSKFHWDDPGNDFQSDLLLDQLNDMFVALGFPCGIYTPEYEKAKKLFYGEAEIPPEVYAVIRELRIPFFQFSDYESGYSQAGFSLTPVPKTEGPDKKIQGFAVCPFIMGEAELDFEITDNLSLILSGGLRSGIAIRVFPDTVDVVEDIYGTGVPFEGEFELALSHHGAEDKFILFGDSDASRLEYESLTAALKLLFSGAGKDLAFEIRLKNLGVIIRKSEGDGFLQKILPEEPIEGNFDITCGFSLQNGFYFTGSGALEITIPIHKQLGPISLDSICLIIKFDENPSLTLAISAGAEIGPVIAAVSKIGITLPFKFTSNNNGNLGFLDISRPCFKPPNGVGFAVDTETVTGGGFLEFDNDNKRYAGMLQLKFQDIGLFAVALITTRMPDGSKGFSILICINVSFSPAISLPYNFKLLAVGGLVGIHRSMIIEVLRRGIKNGTLNSILFPEDPIANAARIISDLRAVFPPTEGRYVFGPMAKFGWNSPPVITGDIGIFIEIPDPVRIVILGQIAAVLPKKEKALVEIHLDMLGVIDFEKKEFAFDASLYDSRIVNFTLSGDAAMRLNWGDNPVFALSIGGFHPRFKAPAGFPILRRLTLSLGSGNNPRISLEAYQAVTSNSVQFGALLELYAKAGKFSVEGYLGFDTIFIFSPFSFSIDMGAGLALKVGSNTIASINLDLGLSGPRPWNARGKASLKIWFIKVKVRFDKTWGSDRQVTLEAINPSAQLITALKDPGNWGGVLPGEEESCILLRELDDTDTADLVLLHPLGFLEIRQRVLPLGLDLDKFGNAPIAGGTRYDLTLFTPKEEIAEGEEDEPNIILDTKDVKEYFARGQFVNMSEGDKLTKASFEKLNAGILLKEKSLDFNKPLPYILEYETICIDEQKAGIKAKQYTRLPRNFGKAFLSKAAAANSPLVRSGRLKFRQKENSQKVSMREEGFTIVSTEDLSRFTDTDNLNDGSLTQTEAEQLLRHYISEHPEQRRLYQVVAECEVAG